MKFSFLHTDPDFQKIQREVEDSLLDKRYFFEGSEPSLKNMANGDVLYYKDDGIHYRYSRISDELFKEQLTPGFTAGSGIQLLGGGGGGANLTVALDVNDLTEESGITDGDFIPFHDTNVGEDRKVDFTDFEAALVAENLSTAIPANRVIFSNGSNLTGSGNFVFDGDQVGINISSGLTGALNVYTSFPNTGLHMGFTGTPAAQGGFFTIEGHNGTPMTVFGGASTPSSNTVAYGGGFSGQLGPTFVTFFAKSSATDTTAGTKMLYFEDDRLCIHNISSVAGFEVYAFDQFFTNLTTGSGATTRQIAGFSPAFATADDATREGEIVFSVFDYNAEREYFGATADGTEAKISWFGATKVAKQAALTTALTQITHTSPGTPDYAIQDLVDSGVGSAFGFATKDEGNTVLSVILNLQTRIDELENRIQNYGLLN